MLLDFKTGSLMREEMDRGTKTTRRTFTLSTKDIERLETLANLYTFGNKSLLIRVLLAIADRERAK